MDIFPGVSSVRSLPRKTRLIDIMIDQSLSPQEADAYSDQPASASVNDRPSVSTKQKIHQHASPDARNLLDPKSQSQLPASPVTFETSTSTLTPEVDAGDLPVLEYDLDQDPTQEIFEFNPQFQERSDLLGFLSARFIHPHLLSRFPDPLVDEEPTNGEYDTLAESINPAAIASVGPHDGMTSSFAVDSTEVPWTWQHPSDYANLGLEGPFPVVADQFAPMTMDDMFRQQPWDSKIGGTINPALLRRTPAISELRSPTPALTPFHDFHSRRRPQLSSPARSVIRIPHASTSRNFEGSQGGGKAKFYRKGTSQTSPHLSNSQSQWSVYAKTTPSASSQPSPNQVPDSPFTEFNASNPLASSNTSMSSIAPSSEVANIVDDSGSSSDTPPPRVTSTETATSQKQRSITNAKGPYRIVAVNAKSYCHQCRRSTPHPKMTCRACAKPYCIMCIVKRYARSVLMQDLARFRLNSPYPN